MSISKGQKQMSDEEKTVRLAEYEILAQKLAAMPKPKINDGWTHLQNVAFEMIKMAELEKFGVRDGGGDVVGHILNNLKSAIAGLEAEYEKEREIIGLENAMDMVRPSSFYYAPKNDGLSDGIHIDEASPGGKAAIKAAHRPANADPYAIKEATGF
jgi:hypothetical protein